MVAPKRARRQTSAVAHSATVGRRKPRLDAGAPFPDDLGLVAWHTAFGALIRETIHTVLAGVILGVLLAIGAIAVVVAVLGTLDRPECEVYAGTCAFGDLMLGILAGGAVFVGTIVASAFVAVAQRNKPAP
jgi:hypothetical protein